MALILPQKADLAETPQGIAALSGRAGDRRLIDAAGAWPDHLPRGQLRRGLGLDIAIRTAIAPRRLERRQPGLTAVRTLFRSIIAGKYAMVFRPTVLYRIRRSNVIWKFMKYN